MTTILLSGGAMPGDGFVLWFMLIAFLLLVVGGTFLCRWIYNRMIHTRWDKNDLTDIID